MEKSMKEEWKPVRGFEDYAEISNYGQIHRFEREWYCGENHKSKRIQEEDWTYGSENNMGYLYACIGGVKKGVHVWVFETFNDCDVPKGYDVNHIDEDKHCNCVWNLNLLSHGDNMRYGTGIERRAAKLRGRKHSPEHIAKVAASRRGKYNTKNSKPVQALDKNGNVVMEFASTREAGRQGFSQGNVAACCRNCYLRLGNNVYKGYIWKNKE